MTAVSPLYSFLLLVGKSSEKGRELQLQKWGSFPPAGGAPILLLVMCSLARATAPAPACGDGDALLVHRRLAPQYVFIPDTDCVLHVESSGWATPAVHAQPLRVTVRF